VCGSANQAFVARYDLSGTQLFARDVGRAGGSYLPAAAVRHRFESPVLEDLWLARSSTPGCEEAMQHGACWQQVREQWKMVETASSVDPAPKQKVRRMRAIAREEMGNRKA
jgi:hypothetical protein